MKPVLPLLALCALLAWPACGDVEKANPDGGAGQDGSTADAAVGPHLVVAPTSQVFGSVELGTSSTPAAFMFTNNGTETVTGCSLPELAGDHPDDFTIETDNCGFDDLEPGASCLVAVAAKPQIDGTRTATLSRSCTAGGTASSEANGLEVNRPMVIFISSVSFTGDLGGLSGADDTCNSLAAAGTMTSGMNLTWKALLSKSTGGVENARDRFVWTGPMFDVFGNKVTQNPASWPWVDGGAGSSIEFNESGGPPDDSYSLSGTTVDGLSQGPSSDCDGWTSASSALSTTAGETSHFPDATWLQSFPSNCNETYYGLYCIGQ